MSRQLGLILGSLFLTFSSLLVPNRVDNRAELANNKLGYPIYFVIQDSSRLSIGEFDSSPFPYYLAYTSPWEHRDYWIWPNFLLSSGLIYVVLNLLSGGLLRKAKGRR